MPVCVFFLLDKDIYIFSAIFASALIWLKNVEVLEGTSVPENMAASASNSVNLVSDSNIDWDSDNNDIARFNYCWVANTCISFVFMWFKSCIVLHALCTETFTDAQ